MILLPAIDLSGGVCVRLRRGDFSEKTVYDASPAAVARQYEAAGASWLHVVDLDGARDGQAAQSDAILALAGETRLSLQVGGGVRSADQIEALLAGGVTRVVVGSLAIEAPARVRRWMTEFGSERIVLAFDVRIREGVPFPATRGWQEDGDASLWAVLERYDGSGLRHVLCTDIDRDGMLAGPNLALYDELKLRAPDAAVQASGGVAALSDLRALRRAGVDGAVIGRALYEGRFALEEALAC